MRNSRIPMAILGAGLGLSASGCGAVGSVVSAGSALLQLAVALAAIALPYLAWYYYHRHQD